MVQGRQWRAQDPGYQIRVGREAGQGSGLYEHAGVALRCGYVVGVQVMTFQLGLDAAAGWQCRLQVGFSSVLWHRIPRQCHSFSSLDRYWLAAFRLTGSLWRVWPLEDCLGGAGMILPERLTGSNMSGLSCQPSTSRLVVCRRYASTLQIAWRTAG